MSAAQGGQDGLVLQVRQHQDPGRQPAQASGRLTKEFVSEASTTSSAAAAEESW